MTEYFQCLQTNQVPIVDFQVHFVLNVKTGEILKESILLKLFQSNLFLNVKTERRISAMFIWKGCSRRCILSQHLYCLCNFYILFHLSRRVWIENCFLFFKLTCFMFFRVYMWLRNRNRNQQRRGRVGQICSTLGYSNLIWMSPWETGARPVNEIKQFSFFS